MAADGRMILAVGAVARRVPARGLLDASVASVDGGRAASVVTPRVAIGGTLRWGHAEDRDAALAEITTTMREVESATGTSGRWVCPAHVPPLCNDASMAALVTAAARDTGRAKVVDPGLLPFADDFAEVARRVPACYFGVGAGGPDAPSHDDPAFDVDERAIGLTAEILTRTALAWRGQLPRMTQRVPLAVLPTFDPQRTGTHSVFEHACPRARPSMMQDPGPSVSGSARRRASRSDPVHGRFRPTRERSASPSRNEHPAPADVHVAACGSGLDLRALERYAPAALMGGGVVGLVELDQLTWPEVEAELEGGRDTVVVAFGATEQHGPHQRRSLGRR